MLIRGLGPGDGIESRAGWRKGKACRGDEGVFYMCPNRTPLPVTSTDPLLWRERATLNLNLTRLMENAGP
ncbi:hypothetical protein OYC64_018839 [Pagothenia borchgrevinki]|uniref:Uncharacterized protein n=1 Tax=Pagothenia borchgrevinki TaxID=8213 RepID=A0ABD2GR94_PAGBO